MTCQRFCSPISRRSVQRIVPSYYVITLLFASCCSIHGEKCGFPGRPAHGFVQNVLYEYEPGYLVYFRCHLGYELVGNERRICNANGTWSHAVPLCVQSTSLKDNIDSGSLKGCDGSRLWDGDAETCISLAKEGKSFYVQLKNSLRVRLIKLLIEVPLNVLTTSNFNFQIASEVSDESSRDCSVGGEKGNPDKVSFQWNRSQTGNIVMFRADFLNPYVKLCELKIVTEENLQQASCGDPEVPLNAIVTRTESQTATYSCRTGYYLVGSSSRECKGYEEGQLNQWGNEAASTCQHNGTQETQTSSALSASESNIPAESNALKTCYASMIAMGCVLVLVGIVGGVCYCKNKKRCMKRLTQSQASQDTDKVFMMSPTSSAIQLNVTDYDEFHPYEQMESYAIPYKIHPSNDTTTTHQGGWKSDLDNEDDVHVYAEVNKHPKQEIRVYAEINKHYKRSSSQVELEPCYAEPVENDVATDALYDTPYKLTK